MSGQLIIKNGHVIDPANDVNEVCDVIIQDGIIQALRPGMAPDIVDTGVDVFDATGCLVTPGLIDAHVHAYEYATPLGVNADRHFLGRGTTTAVDAGSAGAGTFPGYRKTIVEQSKTRLFAFLHIASHGMAAAGCAGEGRGGESDSLNQLDVNQCLSCIKENLDLVVGVKVRLASNVCNDGKNEKEAFRRALEVSQKAKLPLMVHHALSTIPKNATKDDMGCPAALMPGDLHTHSFHGEPSTLYDPKTGRIHDAVIEARRNGVLFDLGHGAGSFNWKAAEKCAELGFFPDITSTDLHTQNNKGPVFDLPTTMSKMLHLGMPLHDIIKSVTLTPAKAIGKLHEIASLGVGRKADMTVLKLEDGDFLLKDAEGEGRNAKKIFKPVAVWKDGVKHPIIPHDLFAGI